MDRIMSTRLDESVILNIRVLAHDLGMSKKVVIEAAVNLFADKTKSNINVMRNPGAPLSNHPSLYC